MANAWDVFRRAPSRGGRGCRAAVHVVVCFACDGISRVFCFVFFFKRTRPVASMRPPCVIYLSSSNEAVYLPISKKASHAGARTRCHYLIFLSVSVCV